MRFLCLLFLLAVGAAVTIFVMQNEQSLTLTFFGRPLTAPVAALVGVAYGLGMLTGWSVVGLLRRSLATATDFRSREAARAR
jgi:lipopolysaccharide assembly protein A